MSDIASNAFTALQTNPVQIYQDPAELVWLLEIFKSTEPMYVLEVGSLYGGTLWHWIQGVSPGGLVVSVDLIVPTVDHRYEDIMAGRSQWKGWADKAGVHLIDLQANSTEPSTVSIVGRYPPFDFIFVDGGHDYETVSRDFSNYYPMLRCGGVMAFHDVAYPDSNIDRIDVGRWWRELKSTGRYWTKEIISRPGTWGIGAVYKQ